LEAKSTGMLVMPLVTEAGLGIGGAFGRGALRVNDITVDYYSATRASAVEAIARRGLTDATPRVAQIAQADDSEPRATAIAALHHTHPGSAIDALQHMLDDERRDHRDRGLWLVESMGLVEMARQVAEMSLSDPDARVRRRAEAVVAELMGLLSRDADATRQALGVSSPKAHAEPADGPTSPQDAEAA
ncbi:MAG: HEAT repeat domain-containing protein, partial [Planctomycetota bacterium]